MEGKLRSFEDRTIILNPYKGPRIKTGKLEQALIKEDFMMEIGPQKIAIAKTPKEVIEKYCENGNAQFRKAEKELKSKSSS